MAPVGTSPARNAARGWGAHMAKPRQLTVGG